MICGVQYFTTKLKNKIDVIPQGLFKNKKIKSQNIRANFGRKLLVIHPQCQCTWVCIFSRPMFSKHKSLGTVQYSTCAVKITLGISVATLTMYFDLDTSYVSLSSLFTSMSTSIAHLVQLCLETHIVLISNPSQVGCLSSSIYSAPNCSNPWSVQCCPWNCLFICIQWPNHNSMSL